MMDFQSHIQYQDDNTEKPEESMACDYYSPHNIIHGEGDDYCELMPLDLCLSSATSLNGDKRIHSNSSDIKMEYIDISYSDSRETHSTNHNSTSYDYGSVHGAEGGLDPISQEYTKSYRMSDRSKLYNSEVGLDSYFRDYNISRIPWSSDGTHVLGAEGGVNCSYDNSNSSEDSNRCFGCLISSHEKSELDIDNFDEVLILQDMFKSPSICAQKDKNPNFPTNAYTKSANTDVSLNASFSMTRYAEKYMQIKEQNKRRAKKYRLHKQQNHKKVHNTIPQLEERNQILKSEYESLKKKIDSLKQLLPKITCIKTST